MRPPACFASLATVLALGGPSDGATGLPISAPGAATLFVSFSAPIRWGPSPLNVAFIDHSSTSDTGGITSWAWDFEDDGTVDSTVQNPSHTYVGGTYAVRLTVTDALHTASWVRVGYVVADPVTASFSVSPTAAPPPLIATFTDTSTGNPTSWAWDFDSDGTIDASAQHPVWPYLSSGRQSVTLTVSNGANAATTMRRDLILVIDPTENTRGAEILEYQFNEPRGAKVANSASSTLAPAFGTVISTAGSPNADWRTDAGRAHWKGNDFGTGCLARDDVPPYGSIVDTGWPIDIVGSHTIMFWTRSAGSTTNASFAFISSIGWGRCFYSGSVLILVQWGTGAFVFGGHDIDVLSGWHHNAVVIDDQVGRAQWYLDGVASGTGTSYPPNTVVLSDRNLIIGGARGITPEMTFTRYFDLDDFRLYARALTPAEIASAMQSENPAATTFGDGCSGPSLMPTIGSRNGAPTLGNAAFRIEATDLEPGRPQAMFLGISANAGGALPLKLGSLLGASHAGCALETLPDFASIPLGGGTSGGVNLAISNDPVLNGLHVTAQAIVLGTLGAVSPALDVNIER